MKAFYIEIQHVDAADDLATDFITEWIDVVAEDERTAFNTIAARFLAVGRAVTSQIVLETR